LVVGNWILELGYRKLVIVNRLLVIGNRLLEIGYWK
jgi:hypothetical protein